MTTSMILKVAKAICNAGREDDLWEKLAHNNSALRTSYLEDAKAAIRAMREPTVEMVNAAKSSPSCGTPDAFKHLIKEEGSFIWEYEVDFEAELIGNWNIMIDEAVRENT